MAVLQIDKTYCNTKTWTAINAPSTWLEMPDWLFTNIESVSYTVHVCFVLHITTWKGNQMAYFYLSVFLCVNNCVDFSQKNRIIKKPNTFTDAAFFISSCRSAATWLSSWTTRTHPPPHHSWRELRPSRAARSFCRSLTPRCLSVTCTWGLRNFFHTHVVLTNDC